MEELYSSKNHLVRWVHLQRLNAIANLVPQKGCLKILDAGCGEGHLLEKLHERYPEHDYYGVDVTNLALQKARERCAFAKLTRMDLVELQFPNEFFHVIIATEVIEHIIDYHTVLDNLVGALNQGGMLVITFPNETLWTISRFFLGRRPIKIVDHVNSFTPQMMKDLVRLEVIQQRNLPFGLRFSMSLGTLMEFRKGAVNL